MIRLLLALLLLFLPVPAQAQGPVEAAFKQATAAFAAARPQLGAGFAGVEVDAYGAVLSGRPFASAYWGGEITLNVVMRQEKSGSCGRFAAFVRMPPENGTILLVICPEFSTPGTESLRRLTILHELVHVVAGPDECRAMAFAAEIERLAFGQSTPVERYWQANGCQRSSYRQP